MGTVKEIAILAAGVAVGLLVYNLASKKLGIV